MNRYVQARMDKYGDIKTMFFYTIMDYNVF
jgi:hypothetical protein